jgi:oligopeptide transport system substrate-binding protein
MIMMAKVSRKVRVAVNPLMVLILASSVPVPSLSVPEPSTPRHQILRIGNGGEPKDLDPQTETGMPEYRILRNLFEGLVDLDPKTLEPIPGVAESWTLSRDHRTYLFKLRPQAKWSNGEPLTAWDFVYSWQRLLSPTTAATNASQAFSIRNAKEFTTGKLKDPSRLGFHAVNRHTLQVTLESPVPYFLRLLHHPAFFPVHRKTIEKFGNRWTHAGNMVSNGAFSLEQWKINTVVRLKKNPWYWDAARVKLTEASFFPVQEEDTEEKMFRRGALDLTSEVPLEKVPFWKNDRSGSYQEASYLGSYFYWINVSKPPLNQKDLRKALALSIDRSKLIQYVLKGNQLPGQFLVPPGCGGYHPPEVLPKDLSRLNEARRLLAGAGYPGGKGFPPIEILYNTNQGHKKIAEALQGMWKTNLGIEIKLRNLDWKTMQNAQRTGDFQLSRMGWIADYNDPMSFLELFISHNGNNAAGYANPAYDRKIAEANREKHPGKRLDSLRQAEEMLLDDMPLIPIYIYTRYFLKNPRVRGWEANLEDYHPLKRVSLK